MFRLPHYFYLLSERFYYLKIDPTCKPFSPNVGLNFSFLYFVLFELGDC